MIALLLSILAHLALYRYNPSLRFSSVSVLRLPPPKAEPLTMDDVQMEVLRRELPRLLDRFARDPWEESEGWAPEVPEVGSLATDLPEAPAISTVPDPSTAAPPDTPPVELPAVADTWQPHQEILQVVEQRMDQKVEVIPRRFVASMPRVPDAPDVVLPVDTRLLEQMMPGPATLARLGPVTPGNGGGGPGGAGGPGLGTLTPIDPIDLVPLPDVDLEVLTEETREDLTDLAPVETLLGLRTLSYEEEGDSGYRYFRIEIFREGIEALPVLPREVILLQDCSESMTRSKLQECIRGLMAMIDGLRPEDTFNILTFRDTVETCFPVSQPADIVRKARGKGFVADLKSFGKTDVYASLQQLERMNPEPGRPLIAVLITDGRPTMGLVDSSDIIEAFTRANRKRISVFGVGGGARANRYLLDFLSYRNQGDSRIVANDNDIPEGLRRVGEELSRPVLAHLDYRFTGREVEVYPRTLTHLYLDRPLVLRGRVPRSQSQFAFQIIGQAANGKEHDMVFSVDLSRVEAGTSDLRTEWARQCILDRIGDYIADKSEENRHAIESISSRYGVSVPYAYSLDSPIQR